MCKKLRQEPSQRGSIQMYLQCHSLPSQLPFCISIQHLQSWHKATKNASVSERQTRRPLLISLQPKPLSSQLVRFIHGAPPGHPEISQRMRPTPGVSRSEVHLLQSPCSPVFTQTTSINDKLACNGHFCVLKNGSVCKLCAPVLLSIILLQWRE